MSEIEFNLDSKLFGDLPLLQSVLNEVQKSRESNLRKYVERLSNRPYYNIFLSTDIDDIDTILFLGGTISYDMKYIEVYNREKKCRNLEGFDRLFKIKPKPRTDDDIPQYKNVDIENMKEFKISTNDEEFSYDIKNVINDKQENLNLFEQECKTSIQTGIISDRLKEMMIQHLQNRSPVYEGKNINERYAIRFDNRNYSGSIKESFCNHSDEVFWILCNSNFFDDSSVRITNSFHDHEFLRYKSEIMPSLFRELANNTESIEFENLENLYFKRFFDIKYVKNVILAGGSILYFMSISTNSPHDYDIFLHSCTQEEAKYIIDTFIYKAAGHVRSVKKTEHAITVYLSTPPDGCKEEEISNTSSVVVQFILRIYKGPSEVVHGFDTCISCVLYDFYTNSYYFTERFAYSVINRINTVNFEKLSPTYEHRLLKAVRNGIFIYIPMFEKIFKNIDLCNVANAKGFCRLMKGFLNVDFFHFPIKYISDYYSEYCTDYSKSDKIKFVVTNPSEQACSTFHKIVLENYKEWFTNEHLKLTPRSDNRKLINLKKTVKDSNLKTLIYHIMRKNPDLILLGSYAASLFTGRKYEGAPCFMIKSETDEEATIKLDTIVIQAILEKQKIAEYDKSLKLFGLYRTEEQLIEQYMEEINEEKKSDDDDEWEDDDEDDGKKSDGENGKNSIELRKDEKDKYLDDKENRKKSDNEEGENDNGENDNEEWEDDNEENDNEENDNEEGEESRNWENDSEDSNREENEVLDNSFDDVISFRIPDEKKNESSNPAQIAERFLFDGFVVDSNNDVIESLFDMSNVDIPDTISKKHQNILSVENDNKLKELVNISRICENIKSRRFFFNTKAIMTNDDTELDDMFEYFELKDYERISVSLDKKGKFVFQFFDDDLEKIEKNIHNSSELILNEDNLKILDSHGAICKHPNKLFRF